MIEQRFLDREEKRKLKSVLAIVVHWPGGDVPTLNGLWEWMNEKSKNSYHYLVSKSTVLHTRDKDFRAIHCGHATYTDKARAYFGPTVCSLWDSPNNYTLGVCMLHDKPNGSYAADTMESAIELLAALCSEYQLDPLKNLLRHSDITDEKAIPCPKAFFEDDDNPDDLWESFKGWVLTEMKDLYGDHRENKSKEEYLK